MYPMQTFFKNKQNAKHKEILGNIKPLFVILFVGLLLLQGHKELQLFLEIFKTLPF